MSKTECSSESRSTEPDHQSVPRNGPARALWEAPASSTVDDIPEILRSVERWECIECGYQTFTRVPKCKQCGGASFFKTTPAEEGGR